MQAKKRPKALGKKKDMFIRASPSSCEADKDALHADIRQMAREL